MHTTEAPVHTSKIIRGFLGSHNKCQSLNHIQLFAAPWTVAHQAPLSMAFSRQEYWSGLPFPPPGDRLDPGIELSLLCLLHCQADSLGPESLGKTIREAVSKKGN